MTTCFPLVTNYSEISNNNYVFTNSFNINYSTTISYGLYDTSINKNYVINNVSINYPLAFFDNNTKSDLSNIITVEPLNKNNAIVIYVSKGQDYSFNNNDFFRFYDTSFQLLNINHSRTTNYGTTTLTSIDNNFYFMNKQLYKFIAITDFCSNQPFIIGNHSLNNIGASFEIVIEPTKNNSNERLFYRDNDNDISGNLFILRDASYSYYYGDISFSINNYRDFSTTKISIKSYDFGYGPNFNISYGNVSISNNDLFYYSETCSYVTRGYSSISFELLNKISAIDLCVNINTFKVGFNKNRHLNNNDFKYDVNYGLSIKDYHIIDISKNYPLRLENNFNSVNANNIYIDENYQSYRLGTINIDGLTYYYGSLKLKVIDAFLPTNVKFISISNNLIDSSYIVSFVYDSTQIALRHIVYDNSSNSKSFYDFSNTILQVKTLSGDYYNLNNYDLQSNKFILNLNTDYSELGYISKDRLNNDLNQFVIITPPIDEINNELSTNFLNNPFYIYYNVTDYEDNIIQNIRALILNAGPIIEISNNYNRLNNKIFDFSINTNSNAASYNFYDDIKVYIYDKSKNKIFIPFDITISGSYFTNINNRRSLSNDYILTNELTIPIRQNYYYSTFINNFELFDDKKLILKNIEPLSITTTNNSSNFVTFLRDFSYIYSDSSSSIVINRSNSPASFNFNITNSVNNVFTVYSFNLASNLTTTINNIDVLLGLNSRQFFYSARNNLGNSVTVSGNFIKPKFFREPTDAINPKLIDLSYIGNYDLKISTKSLGSNDNYLLEYSGNFFDQSITNKSETYSIRVADNIPPTLKFYDISGKIATNLTYFKHFFTNSTKFNFYSDICFTRLSSFIALSNEYVDIKPVLLYSDDSIYDLCINFLDISTNSKTGLTVLTNEISLNTFNDISCTINYRIRDLCYNYSDFITLEVNFVNIPDVTLNGSSIVVLNYTNNLSYIDNGLKFYINNRGTSNEYKSAKIYDKTNSGSGSIIDPSNFNFNSTINYEITERATDICFSQLGTYYFKYTIKQTAPSGFVYYQLNLQRLVRIVDISSPWIYFPATNFIIESSNGSFSSNYNANDRPIKRSIDGPITNIDICFNFTARTPSFIASTAFTDISRVLYNFDLCDNYFKNNDLSYLITLNDLSTPFALSDISPIYSSSVTYPSNSSNYAPPLQFNYKITDGNNNVYSFVRNVNIIDLSSPSINFGFSNYYTNFRANQDYHYYKDYSYVQFSNFNRDFSYLAFNYLKSGTSRLDFDFNQEISSILFDFTLNDNLPINQNNFTITLSNSLLPKQFINRTTYLTDISFKSLFSKIGSSFSLIYDISDNQNISSLPFQFIRNVKIVDYISDISRNFEYGYKDPYIHTTICNETLSFGDTNFNIIRDVSLVHNRLTRFDISYDISYMFIANSSTINDRSTLITSISGTASKLYDPSALIYNLGLPSSQLKSYTHDIKYFPIALSVAPYNNNYKILSVTVKNYGPQIRFPVNNANLSHQSYTTLTDASLIFGVSSISIYDVFYYYNYFTSISYSGTNFKVTLDSSLNVNDPKSGTYDIIYESKDKNNVDVSLVRRLIVSDSQAPFIRTICGDNIYELSNNIWTVNYDSPYIEYGAIVYDSASKNMIAINGIVGTIRSISGSLYNPYRLHQGILYSISYRVSTPTNTFISISYELINTRLTDICYQVIYSIFDLCSNEVSANRLIKIVRNKKPLLYPYIEIDISTSTQKTTTNYYLLRDLSNREKPVTQINALIPRFNTGEVVDISYDLSLVFINSNNNKIIICEALKPIVFIRARNANYVKFKLHATSYDGSRNSYNGFANSSISTRVDYSINSINVWNSPIDFQVITFYAIDNCVNVVEQENRTTFYLKIIDTKPPNVSKLTNINFSNPNILNYPLLSQTSITNLIENNLNYYDTYENAYLNYIRYYKLIRPGPQDASKIVLIDPGIMFDDIVDGSANYINDVLSSGSNFMLSDISVTYFKDPSYIDVSDVLTISGQYIQNYRVKDRAGNKTDVSRVIIVKSFPPIIKLNYQKDNNGNEYTKYLTQIYDKYIELNGTVRDYKDSIMYFDNVAIDYSNLNESSNGLYTVNYTISNSMYIVGRTQRNVEVYSPIVLKKDLCNNFIELFSNFNNTTKFSLANGSYKFYVTFNYAFTIVAQDFDTSKNSYDISNLITINSDLSAVANNEKYYYNNVNLTIIGDFERCSIKFKDISNISSPFKDYLIAKIFRNFFIYDNLNYFINLQTYYNSLQDANNIDASFQIDVDNINNSTSGPYFIIDGVRKDLHLSYGVYRFHQSTYKNFYNRIRFSITPDGTHNGGIEYTKTVFVKNLPGVSRLSNNLNIYTQIRINATTPMLLYYYSENFRNMGGKIILKNNIVFLKKTLILNSYVLTNYTNINSGVSNEFLGVSNEIMRNRIVLNQRFDISLNNANVNRVNINTISNINICCITQQNIKNNILYDLNQHPDKLIFQKYNAQSNSAINTITSSSYLLDASSASEFNASYKSYITYFNTTYESSYSLINKPQLNTYDKSLKNVFYYNAIYNPNNVIVNNEILNYIHFFKSNNVIPSELLVKDFSYAISEFLFHKQSNILNLESSNIYNYSSNTSSYLLAPRIKITNIIDNYVIFSLDVKYKHLHFQTFDFLIYSSNFTSFPNPSDTISMDRLFFINGSLVIASNMLYSNSISGGFYDGSSIFNSIYPSEINKVNILKNMVFLNINETEISNNAICGITKQNLYNNMYLDENNNFIFHKYNENTIVNYQVNDANLTLEKTLKENSNNQLYLIDVCSNIFYNSFNNDALTIDALKDLSNNANYSIALTYKIYNELDVSINFNILTSLYIDPLYINDIPLYRFIDSLYNRSVPNFRRTDNLYDICYNYNINANTSLSTTRYGVYTNSLHSNSYTINLQDYFDVNLVNNRFQSTSFSTNIINPDNLIYTLIDMSYSNKNFSLFDLDASFNIIYDKFNITILNSMQIKLFGLYYKLQYLINLLNIFYSIKYYINSIPYTTSINIQFYAEDFDDYDFINKSLTSKLSTSNINNLYYEILTNTVGFINTYNNLINYFRLFIYSVITLNPLYNDFTFNSLVITQLIFDINKLIENVDTIILNEHLKFAQRPTSSIFTSYSDISNIEYVFSTFFNIYNISQTYIKSFNTLKSQNYINAVTISSELLNISTFKNLFERINLEPVNLLENLKINLRELNTIVNILHINYFPLKVVNVMFDINITDISNFNLLIFQYNRLKGNINLINSYRALEVANLSYINNNFELLNSQILIHSKVSNSISLSFNVRYKSYFFYYIDLSTIVLDVTIPDLSPPIVTFTNNDYSFNQTDLNDNSINSVLSNLISNVNYIDLNQSLNLTINNTNYTYNQDITNLVTTNAISYPLLSIDLTSINNRLEFDSKNTALVDIYYIIKDNANNVNTIIRKLIINKSDDGPIFYYKISENEYVPIVNNIPPLTIDEDKNVGQLIAALINNIYIIDPRKVREFNIFINPVLNASQFTIIYNQAQVNLSTIEIFDLSDNKIDSYNVLTNQYTNFFNTTDLNGQLLANSSKMFLTVAVGRYTLKYRSVASSISGYITNKTRVLTINAVNVIIETPIVTHCCYPRVEYKAIQDNYKLGSQNTTVMRYAKYIVNRNR